jgi:hypothetical protein
MSNDDVIDALQDIQHAVGRVENAVKRKWTTVHWLGVLLVGIFLWSLPGRIWYSKWRYAATNGLSADKVSILPKRHDCAFLASPLGEKYCHYERRVETSTGKVCPTGYTLTPSTDSCYDSSYPYGKGATVTPHEKVTAVSVWWEREED